jgi:hypothetical protein
MTDLHHKNKNDDGPYDDSNLRAWLLRDREKSRKRKQRLEKERMNEQAESKASSTHQPRHCGC